MQDVQKQIGDTARAPRLKKGWSQDVFADRSGLNRAHMGEIECVESNVTIQMLKLVADTLGVSIVDLVRELIRKRRFFRIVYKTIAGVPAFPGAAAGPGGRGGRGRGAGAPAQPPVVLSRGGKEYNVTGTNVRAGTEIKVTTERPTVSLNLTELARDSWVIFQLPGFTTVASGQPEDSLDPLRMASATSWVKVVSHGDPGNGVPGGGTSLQVSR